MTSYFPYYLALFGLLFFISVICCCIKLIDIIDRPVPRPSTGMPSWNYANYLQNSPVQILSPQNQEPFLRCAMLAGPHGFGTEEYLTATATPSCSQYNLKSSMNHHHQLPQPPPPAPAPSPNPHTDPPGVYRIPVPDEAVLPTPSPIKQQRLQQEQSRRRRENFRKTSSLRERENPPEIIDEGPRRSRSRSSMREASRYDNDICFDV